ncbi:hypothetical protein D3C87_1698390 [compost metagenome]
MNSNSESSTVRPPTSVLLARTASAMSVSEMSCAFSRTGSTTMEYCLTKPPTLATSATPSDFDTANRTTQSCRDRSCASDICFATTAY